MCGIFGIYNINKEVEFDAHKLESSVKKMIHRGPDACGIKIFGQKVALAHLRLSIIDLKQESNQPFQIQERYWITFNGEIYNYIEIRNELESLGYSFRTESDTEVLLKSYQVWGEDCVNHFNGMWAFAIYDLFEKKLFCSRDRFGIKPFNYSIVGSQFIFSSEIKGIINYFPELKRPNYNIIANFCRTSVGAQQTETWFENVFRLQPAHNIVIKESGLKVYRYWSYPSKINKRITFDEAKEKYKELFLDAVKIRMRSDVPVGTTLSSGLDSSSIVCALREFYKGSHSTFTAKFNSKEFDKSEKVVYKDQNIEIDEASQVEKIAQKIHLSDNYVNVSYDNFVTDCQNIIYFLESGNSSPAILPLMQVIAEAKQQVTVVLEGQGADELLCGYVNPIFYSAIIDLLKKGKFRAAGKSISKFKENYSLIYALLLFFRNISNRWPLFGKIYSRYHKLDSIYDSKLSNYIKIKDYPALSNELFDDPINSLLRKQHAGGLVNLLHYGDAISMANSIESRLPFMDYRLIEFAFRLPWRFKLKDDLGKYLHREALKDIVPDEIRNNRVKFGFNSPISQFFKSSYKAKNNPISILLSDRCTQRGIFRKKELGKLIKEHEMGKTNHSPLLFRLLSVELWFRTFIDPVS